MKRFAAHPVAEGLAALVFTVYVALPLLDRSKLVIGFDTITYTGPNSAFTASSWRHLRIPEWNDAIFGGVPHLANPQTGVFYPLRFPFLFMDTRRAIGLITLLHFIVLCVGIVVLVRGRMRLRAPAGFVAAVAVIGSGMLMPRSVQFEQFVAVAWAPWLLVGIDWVVRSPRSTRWSVPFLAVIVATMVTGAHPQALYILMPLGLLWAVGRALDSGSVRRIWLVAAAGALGAFLAAPHLLPALVFSSRAAHPVQTLESVSYDGYVIVAKRLVPTVLGDVFNERQDFVSGSGENVTSIGAAVATLALIGAFTSVMARRGMRWTAAALSVVGVFGLVLALGPRTFVFRFLFRVAPIFNNARVPARWRDITVLCAALLAALAVDRLRSREFATRALVSAGAFIGALTLAVAIGPFDLPPAKTVIFWFVASALCFGAFVLARSRKFPVRIAGAALVAAVVLVELGSMVPDNFLRRSEVPAPTAATPGAAAQFLHEKGDRVVSLTVSVNGDPQYLLDGLRPNTNVLAGVRMIDGYDGGVQVTKEWANAVRALENDDANSSEILGVQLRTPFDPDLMARFGVRYALINLDLLQPPEKVVPGWIGPLVTDGVFVVYENPAYRGEAFLYPSSRPLSADRPSGDQIRALDGPQLNSVVLTDTGSSPLVCGSSCVGTEAQLQRLHPGAMRVETDVTAPSVLATDEQWDKGWSATVDGHSVPVTRVDGAFVGVALNPGHHVVEWHYSAPGLKAGLVLAFLALAMCIAICCEAPAALSRRLRSRREAAAPPT